ncbi:uncharacterized protein LOC143020684 isoform X2 [Oratosquilla oratoria]|uniref:uncharacterized protein LOC143020684 isoform X2 n=1 Tax=Oratosquilla oratoria TaxID=337810 RepID=UPI003F775778
MDAHFSMQVENLKKEVTVKLSAVEDAILSLEQHNAKLQENANKIKEDIHASVKRQIGALQNRELQLVRQVEVVTAHQTSLINTKQASLHHAKGALSNTLQLLNQCSSSDQQTLAKIRVEDLASVRNIRPINLVSVDLDEATLNSAVSTFGQMSLPDSITHQSSSVIPTRMEEYEDEEHGLVHKSVATAASGPDSPMHITVQFPKLSKQSWLANNSVPKERSTLVPPPSKVIKTANPASDVASWLGSLHLSTASEDDIPTMGWGNGFEMVNNSIRSSVSSSIEVVSHQDIDSVRDDCSVQGTPMVEIENLDDLYVSEKSRWLSPKRDSAVKSALASVDLSVNKVCRANEPCASFADCVCKNNGNCGEVAMEKALQSVLWKAKRNRKRPYSVTEGTGEILDRMSKVLASCNSDWLVKGLTKVDTSTPAKKIQYETPEGEWLRLATEKQTPPQTPAARIQFSTHSNMWLLHKLKNDKEKLKEKANKEEQNEKEYEKAGNKTTISESILEKKLEALSIDKSDFLLPSKSLDLGSRIVSNNVSSWLLQCMPPSFSSPVMKENFQHGGDFDEKLKWLISKKEEKLSSPTNFPDQKVSSEKFRKDGREQWLIKTC